MNKCKRKLSEPKVCMAWCKLPVWTVVAGKGSCGKAKVALRKAKDKPYKAMGEYYEATGGECSHREEVFALWENHMCCPKLCFICGDAETDEECDGGTNNPDDDHSV